MKKTFNGEKNFDLLPAKSDPEISCIDLLPYLSGSDRSSLAKWAF